MNENIWAERLAEQIYKKQCKVIERTRGAIPYTAVNGRWDDMSEKNICWWTNGFWAGLLWQLFGAFQNARFRTVAEEIERKLDQNFMRAGGMDHDSGFKWLLTAGANYRLTGSEASKNRLLLAADNLAGRFNPVGNFIRAWNDDGDGSKAGWAIIDCMMNLPLLYEASELTRDMRYRHIAERHALTAAKHFIRPDGSSCHIVAFDPVSGEKIKSIGGQGRDERSAWTRGQAWALYGFALSYRHTRKGEFLKIAERCASYFISHIPQSGLIPVDFCAPDAPWEDSSAAAIASCGLIELYRATQNAEYLKTAQTLVEALAEKRCDLDEGTDCMIENASVAFWGEEHNIPLVYADYFFTEAVLKLCGKETFLW